VEPPATPPAAADVVAGQAGRGDAGELASGGAKSHDRAAFGLGDTGTPPSPANALRPAILPPAAGRAAAGRAGVVPAEPAEVFAEVDVADPRVAAAQFRGLLTEVESARAALERRTRADQNELVAGAQRYRDAAAAIRTRVEEVWDSIAGPLAQHGLSDLDQLRPQPGDLLPPLKAGSDPAVALDTPGRPQTRAQAGHSADHGRPLARPGRRSSRHHRAPKLPARATGPSRPRAVAPPPIDPEQATRDGYQHCREAMSQAAELRGVSRAAGSASAGLVGGAACLLAGGLTALVRIFLGVGVLPCIGVAGVLGWLAVASVTDGGRIAAVKAGLVAAGSSGVAVLATLRIVPSDPIGVAAALAALALAIRFGLGFGAPRPPGAGEKPHGGSRGRPR
jgi:hypothetical protein